jgi:hypothetical protein
MCTILLIWFLFKNEFNFLKVSETIKLNENENENYIWTKKKQFYVLSDSFFLKKT